MFSYHVFASIGDKLSTGLWTLLCSVSRQLQFPPMISEKVRSLLPAILTLALDRYVCRSAYAAIQPKYNLSK